MLFTVHFEDDSGARILLGVFLMRSDAVLFVDNLILSNTLVISEVNNWKAWQSLIGEIK